MDLFEYQGKSLYQDYDISHPKSSLVKDPNELEELIPGLDLFNHKFGLAYNLFFYYKY